MKDDETDFIYASHNKKLRFRFNSIESNLIQSQKYFCNSIFIFFRFCSRREEDFRFDS